MYNFHGCCDLGAYQAEQVSCLQGMIGHFVVSAASSWAASRFDARQTTSIIALKAFSLLGMDQRLIR